MNTKIKQWFQENSWPIILFFTSRLGLFLLAYLSLILIPVVSGEGFWRAFPNNLFLDGWARWDSGWYINIAKNGYSDQLQNVYLNTAFFPMYPMLIKGFQFLIRDYAISGILISNLSLLCACVFLFKVISTSHGEDVAKKSILLLLLNPFSFFFSAVYTESFFLLAVTLVFYFGQRKQWLAAAICSAIAGATRLVGIISLLPLLYYYFESINFKWREVKANFMVFSLGLVGPGGYMVYQTIKFGDAFLFVQSQNAPGWKEGVNLFSALDALRITFSPDALTTGNFPAVYAIHILAFILGLSLLLVSFRSQPKVYSIWAIITLLVSFSVWISVGRFMIVIFPLYICVATLFKGKWFDAMVYSSAMLLSLFTILFTHWYWVG